MNKQFPIILLAIILLVTGCKKKEASTEADISVAENYIPAGPLHTAVHDYSTPPERIDVESGIESSSPVRLSQVASNIMYYAVGDDKYSVTDVVAVDGGFIALNQPKLYLYRKGMKRKRVGLKTEYNNWFSKQHLYYDKETTRLYAFLKKITPESAYAVKYIGVLPPLDSVLARVYYLYPDSLPAYYYPKFDDNKTIYAFNKEMYVMPRKIDNWYDEGISTFALNGDTICRFQVGIDEVKGKFPDYFMNVLFDKAYWYNDMLTFRLSYCDTIFRLPDKQTIKPAFDVHLGKYKFSLEDVRVNANRKGKAWMTSLMESPQAVFLEVHKEGKSSTEGWITEAAERDQPSVDYKVIYRKADKRTVSLPVNSRGLLNDLDEGIPFWPEGQTDEYLYMIRPATELKKSIQWTGSAKQKELKAFLDGVADDQNVLIVVL